MPFHPGHFPGSKYNPKIYRGPAAVQQAGGKTTRFDAAKFQRDAKEDDANGTVKWVHAGKLRPSSPEKVLKQVDTADMDVDTSSAEALTVDENLDKMDRDSTEDRNLNPVQTSTTANYMHEYAMAVATELCKTVTVPNVDIGRNLVNELDETSDLQINPVGTPHGHEVEIQHFNLMGCPEEFIQQVISHFVVKDEPVKPYWNFGALQASKAEGQKDNIPLPIIFAFACHKQLVSAATTLLYGKNTFVLGNAKLALWWLERIGSTNLAKLKRLQIKVEGGEMDTAFRVLHESLWYKVFITLHEKHHSGRLQGRELQELEVDFSKWTRNPPTDAQESRDAIIRTLLGFRGLRKAKIVHGPYVSPWTAGVIQSALLMNPGQTSADVTAVEDTFRAPQRVRYSFK